MAAQHWRRLAASPLAELISRGLAALVAGYLLAFGVTAFLSVYLPLQRPDRVVVASLLCFAVWVGAAVYSFAARRPLRVWVVLVALAGALCLAAWLPTDWRMRP